MNTVMQAVLLAAGLAGAALAATPQVSEVTGERLGSRRMRFSYSVDAPAVVTVAFETNVSGSAWAACDRGALFGTAAAPAVSGAMNCEVSAGRHEFKLNLEPGIAAVVDGGTGFRARVTAHALDDKPVYMTVDLAPGAAGPARVRYYDSAIELPGGVMDTAYRTTKMLFKKVRAGGATFTMGSFVEEQRRANEAAHRVTLAHGYYLGVFPMTQRQCSLIYGSDWSSNFPVDGAMRIRDRIYCELYQPYARGASYYPNPPTGDSLLGKLRTLTGGAIDFDLPSEAQWEFACRAGTREVQWNDGSAITAVDYQNYTTDENIPGRYRYNQADTGFLNHLDRTAGTENGTPIAGSYPPNRWGFYDMHGGVEERCLDWYQEDIAALNGAVNCDGDKRLDGTQYLYQVVRGGAWCHSADMCRTAFRRAIAPGYTDDHQEVGMRVACRNGLK